MSARLEPVLNDLSIVNTQDDHHEARRRLELLARLALALTRAGFSSTLRHTAAALARPLTHEHTFKQAIFKLLHDRDERQRFARAIDRAPYLESLFQEAEGARAMEARYQTHPALALGYVALLDGVALSLDGAPGFEAATIPVTLTSVDETSQEELWQVNICHIASQAHLNAHEARLRELVYPPLRDGAAVLNSQQARFPHLIFGPDATRQLAALTGHETWFPKLVEHLSALHEGVTQWVTGPFQPAQHIRYSEESAQTLNHRFYGPKRDFAMPQGYAPARFSWHSKITAREGQMRVYFMPLATHDARVVIIGYLGPHLPTVSDPT